MKLFGKKPRRKEKFKRARAREPKDVKRDTDKKTKMLNIRKVILDPLKDIINFDEIEIRQIGRTLKIARVPMTKTQEKDKIKIP